MVLPKLPILLADFPYPPCPARLEAADLGDLLRFRYDAGCLCRSPLFSRCRCTGSDAAADAATLFLPTIAGGDTAYYHFLV